MVNNHSQLLNDYSFYYNSLFDLLSLFDEFKNECRALIKTNRIIEYIFKNKKLSPDLKNYVTSVFKSFSSLLKFKLNILKGNASDEEYNEVYSNFREELSINNDFFFSEIYVQTHELMKRQIK